MMYFKDPVLPVLTGPRGLQTATDTPDKEQVVFHLAGNPRIKIVEERPEVLGALHDLDYVPEVFYKAFTRPACMRADVIGELLPRVEITLSPPNKLVTLTRLWLCSDYNGEQWQQEFGLNRRPAYAYELFVMLDDVFVCTYPVSNTTAMRETVNHLFRKMGWQTK